MHVGNGSLSDRLHDPLLKGTNVMNAPFLFSKDEMKQKSSIRKKPYKTILQAIC